MIKNVQHENEYLNNKDKIVLYNPTVDEMYAPEV